MRWVISAAILLRWYHPAPETVDGFKIIHGRHTIDVGMPVPTDGVYEYEYPSKRCGKVRVIAYNEDGDSEPSNARLIGRCGGSAGGGIG